MISHVIFDVDGTLVDSVDLHADAWRRAFAHFGRTIAADEIRGQIGKGGDQLIPVFLSPDEVDRFGEALDRYRGELFRREYLARVRPLPHVRDLFERLVSDGRQLALASSAAQPELEHYKTLLGIGDLLDGATSADDAERSKPEPDIFLAALRLLGEPPASRTVVVGDSPWDSIAAGRAGLRTIGVLAGGFPEVDLQQSGCIAIFQDPEDLLHRYDESPLRPAVISDERGARPALDRRPD